MHRLAVAVVVVMGLSAPARAGVEIGGTAGLHIFSKSNALGTQKNDIVGHANSALFGLRLGIYLGDMIGIEAEGGVSPTESDGGNDLVNIWNAVARGHLILQLRAGDPSNHLLPFISVGGGAMRVVQSSKEEIIRLDTDGVVYAGLGAKYRAGGGWGVRLDVRAIAVPDNTGKQFTLDFEGLASLYREFGRKAAPKPVDTSKDDGDPDGDGIAGAADKCPKEAEDKDDHEDDDGCPDADNDSDGIPDTSDTCAKEPEDKDNYQDDDGCPELDNDSDGVPDAADKCADQPETRNGFADDDGCSDEIPEQLAKFTGIVQGITFKVNSADLVPASNKVLEKIVGVLSEYEAVRVEIGVHTDDQALKAGGKFADNDALSLARAEAIKAYLVGKGIDEGRLVAKGYGSQKPIQDPTGLKGAKLAAARTVNRRVELALVVEEAGGAGTKPPEEPKAEKTDDKAEDKADEKLP